MTPTHYVLYAIITILLSVISYLVGLAKGHYKLAAEVRAHAVEISQIKIAFDEERERMDKRIYEVVRLVQNQVDHTGKVIEQNMQVMAKCLRD